ncbi:MAG: hypothetical protein R2698_10255 [Microthrixaceae bacterium]
MNTQLMLVGEDLEVVADTDVPRTGDTSAAGQDRLEVARRGIAQARLALRSCTRRFDSAELSDDPRERLHVHGARPVRATAA